MVVANKSQIKANAIYKITSKTDGKTCWMVPSDSSSELYKVCFNEASQQWECGCKHGAVQASRGQDAHCCHVAAVQTSVKANLQTATQPEPESHSCAICGKPLKGSSNICGYCIGY